MIGRFCKQTLQNFYEKSKNKKVVLWGLVEENIKKAKELSTQIECIIDSDPEHSGLRFDKIKIYMQEHLYALSPDTHVVLVTSRTANAYSVNKAIKEIGDYDIFFINVIEDRFFEYFSNRLYDNLYRINSITDTLYDDRSKKIYKEVVHRRIIGATGEFNILKTRDNPQYIYLPMFADMGNDEIFIDCGGYIGDSIEKFVNTFGNKVKKIYSFECFPENIKKIREMSRFVSKEEGYTGEIIPAQYALSDKTGKVKFNDIGKPESGYLPETRLTVEYNEKLAPVNTIEVDTTTIDSYIPENEKITFIKMDIEGAEYEALKGAEKIIKKYKPRLAISIYHNPDDYWRIYDLIHSFFADYKFAVRHHQNNHLDTVLYAWVEE